MKVRSIDELEDVIAQEYSWRRKELTNIKNLALTNKSHTQKLLLKTAVVLLYSHWEGFIKKISIAFCDYLNFQGLKYRDVNSNFHVCAVMNNFQGYPPRNYNSVFKIVTGQSIEPDEKVKINSEKYIDCQSNLNSEVLREITQKVGVDYSSYQLKENLIDEKFLGLRNAISHGEYRSIEVDDFTDLYDEITCLMNDYKNQLSNIAITRAYLTS